MGIFFRDWSLEFTKFKGESNVILKLLWTLGFRKKKLVFFYSYLYVSETQKAEEMKGLGIKVLCSNVSVCVYKFRLEICTSARLKPVWYCKYRFLLSSSVLSEKSVGWWFMSEKHIGSCLARGLLIFCLFKIYQRFLIGVILS